MSRSRTKTVAYIFPISHHFRVPFHERVRVKLAALDIKYEVVYSNTFGDNLLKADTLPLKWGIRRRLLRIPGTNLILQNAFFDVLRSDLVVVQQENRLLINYFCLVLYLLGVKRIAYFGHGRNFQSRNQSSFSERLKAQLVPICDWWFTYTAKSQEYVCGLGFPERKTTILNNSIDTAGFEVLLNSVTPVCVQQRRSALGLIGEAVGIYVGGLYEEKRIDFLIGASDKIKVKIPAFELIIVGGGPEEAKLHQYAATRPWLRVLGPQFGKIKAELMTLADVFMMPGLVGLAVLDAGLAGLPVVTTQYPYHSPEIAYLEHGYNGLIVPNWEDPSEYATAVVGLMTHRDRLSAMAAAARSNAKRYSIEGMASNFVDGVTQILSIGTYSQHAYADGRACALQCEGPERKSALAEAPHTLRSNLDD